MTTWLVSRHPGTIEWLRRHGYEDAQLVAHLDPATIRTGDTVIGTLPLHIAADVCARGADFLFISLNIPAELRGVELDAQQLEQMGIRLERFFIERKDINPSD